MSTHGNPAQAEQSGGLRINLGVVSLGSTPTEGVEKASGTKRSAVASLAVSALLGALVPAVATAAPHDASGSASAKGAMATERAAGPAGDSSVASSAVEFARNEV